MNKSLVVLLALLLAVIAPAAVKKKRFDVGGAGETPAATEVVAPAEGTPAAESVAPVAEPEKTPAKSRSFYTVIADEQKLLREKLTVAITAMKSGDWGAIWKSGLHASGEGERVTAPEPW